MQVPFLFFLVSVVKRVLKHDAGIKHGPISVGDQRTDRAREPIKHKRCDEIDDWIVRELIKKRLGSSGNEFSLKLIALIGTI